MQISLGVLCPGLNKACKILKSLYGLKQASRQWFDKLITFLMDCGYTQSTSDDSLFINMTNSHTTVLLIYINDIILVGNSLEKFGFIK